MDFLEAAAKIPGIYVPMFYDVAYNEDGTIAVLHPEQCRYSGDHHQGDGYGYERCSVSGEAGSSYLSRLPRTVWFWRSSAAVSVAAVSARQAMFTVRSGNAAWNI